MEVSDQTETETAEVADLWAQIDKKDGDFNVFLLCSKGGRSSQLPISICEDT